MSLARKSVSLFKRDMCLFVTNMLTGVVVARKLGPSALGVWVILQMVVGYAESLGRTKCDIAAVYFLGKNKYRMCDVVFTLNVLAIGTGVLILGAIVWNFEWMYRMLFAKTDVDARMLVYLMVVQLPFQFLGMNYTYLYIYREDVRTYNRMVIIKSLVSSMLGIALLVFLNWGLYAVVVGSVVSVLAGLLYGMARFGRVEGKPTFFNVPLLRDLFAYGLKLYVSGVIGQVNAYMTRLIVVFYLMPAQVAYFAMAQNQGQLLNKIPDALNTILFPRISKTASCDEAVGLAANAYRIMLLILVLVGSVAFLCVAPVVGFLYGEAYLPMVRPFRIILPGLVLAGASTVIDQYFLGIGRADISAKVAVVPLVVQLLAGGALVPKLGLVGAALALLASLLSLSAVQLVIFVKLTRCSPKKDLLIGREDFQMVANVVGGQIRQLMRPLSRVES